MGIALPYVKGIHPQISTEGAEVADKIDRITSLFSIYCESFPSIFAQNLGSNEIEETLFDFLISRDESLTAAEAALLDSDADGAVHSQFESEGDYVCARFIQYLEESHQELFLLLGDISNAAILSEVIAELGEGRKSQSGRSDVTVYIDAPLMMDFIGLSGSEGKAYADSVISGLRELGARIAIFDHSVEEIRDNIYGLLRHDPPQRRGPTADAMRRQVVDEAFVSHVMHNVEEVVSDAGVPIMFKPFNSMSVQEKGYLTDEDVRRIYQLLSGHYRNQKTLERDVESLRIVLCRRRGTNSTNFLKSTHLMLTRNPQVRLVSRKFAEENKGTPKHRVPAAEHISKIAAALWLELGPGQKVAMSRGALVTACSRVVATRPEIIEKFRKTIQKINPEKAEQFDILITQPRSTRMAMDSFLGNPDYVTDETAAESFDRMVKDLTRDSERNAERQRRQLQEAHDEEIADIRAQATASAAGEDAERARRHSAIRGVHERAVQIGKQWGSRVSLLVMGIGITGTFVTAANALTSEFGPWRIASGAAVVIMLILSYFGIQHDRIVRIVQNWWVKRAMVQLRRNGLLDDSESVTAREDGVRIESHKQGSDGQITRQELLEFRDNL